MYFHYFILFFFVFFVCLLGYDELAPRLLLSSVKLFIQAGVNQGH